MNLSGILSDRIVREFDIPMGKSLFLMSLPMAKFLDYDMRKRENVGKLNIELFDESKREMKEGEYPVNIFAIYSPLINPIIFLIHQYLFAVLSI